MPKEYEAIRDSYLKRGIPLKEAKSLAAATFCKRHPEKAEAIKAKYGKKKEYKEEKNLIEQ